MMHWVGHEMWSQNCLLRTTLEQNPVGKRPLGRPKLRWENIVKRNVNWKKLAMNRDG